MRPPKRFLFAKGATVKGAKPVPVLYDIPTIKQYRNPETGIQEPMKCFENDDAASAMYEKCRRKYIRKRKRAKTDTPLTWAQGIGHKCGYPPCDHADASGVVILE
jgi:hypothetical protein